MHSSKARRNVFHTCGWGREGACKEDRRLWQRPPVDALVRPSQGIHSESHTATRRDWGCKHLGAPQSTAQTVVHSLRGAGPMELVATMVGGAAMFWARSSPPRIACGRSWAGPVLRGRGVPVPKRASSRVFSRLCAEKLLGRNIDLTWCRSTLSSWDPSGTRRRLLAEGRIPNSHRLLPD